MKNLPLILLCVVAFFFIKKRFFDNTDYKTMLSNGGIIIDVRSEGEFYSGHIENSLNIPLGELSSKMDQFKDKNQLKLVNFNLDIAKEAMKEGMKALKQGQYIGLVGDQAVPRSSFSSSFFAIRFTG